MTTTTKHPISLNHPDYEAGVEKWTRCRDACGGSDSIKAAREKYLPRLSGHKGKNVGKYDAYLKRALFYNAARRTRIGLSGAATLRPAEITASTAAEPFAHDIADELSQVLVDESLEVGRYAIVINQEGRNDPFFTRWWAEAIVNWDWSTINGKSQLSLLVLQETIVNRDPMSFNRESVVVRHAYALMPVGEGFVCQYMKAHEDEKAESGWVEDIPWSPVTMLGDRVLDHIPARIFGSLTADETDIEDPLLLDLVDVNISHYQNSADLEHGRHWCALPTAIAVGFPSTDREGQPTEFSVGGESAWVSEIPGASASYLEFSGSGLGHIAEGMKEKQAMMAVLGARLLEEQKPSVEAAETIKTRLTGEKSVLSRVATNVSNAMSWTLQEMMRFKIPNYEGEDRIDLNTDFIDKAISPAQLQAIMSAVQDGMISYPSAFVLLKNAELIPKERTLEEELTLIDQGWPGKIEAPPVPRFPF